MHPRLHEIEKLYRRIVHDPAPPAEMCRYLLGMYNDLVILLSEASSLHFNTLFARVSFIAARYGLSKPWAYALQVLRREMHHREMTDDELLPVLKSCIPYLILLSHREFNPEEDAALQAEPKWPTLPFQKKSGKARKKYARVVAVEWDPDQKQLTVLDENEPDTSTTLQYCIPGINDLFADTLEMALREIGMPLILGLVDIETTDEGVYIPSYIVILPDLLLDVTSITQMMTDGPDPLAYNVIDIFLPSDPTGAIMTGNIANFLLDELVRDTDQAFSELFSASFKVYPIEFVRMSDDQVRSMQQNLEVHYKNIRHVINERFPALGIDRKLCVIEPSYFSPRFGIKGRLDLYYEQPATHAASIIELKSNKPFRPNSYGLSSANYHQTLLYDLLLRSGHGGDYKRSNYILYSAENQESLRYAVSIEALQKETIHNRNQLVLLQFRQMKLDVEGARDLFAEVNPTRYESVKGYVKRNIEYWENVYSALSPGEKNYFKSFTAFITREHTLARIGSDRGDGSGGLAGLWLDSQQTKEERYQILQGLELMAIEKDPQQTIITFHKSARTNPLANFRVGDIAVMYPYTDEPDLDPTMYQLYRANVTYVGQDRVTIRLRNKQVHTALIEQSRYWNLEHDLLDSSFRSLYQSLWALMTADVLNRQVILGLTPPMGVHTDLKAHLPPGLTLSQEKIYHEAIQAGSLYLLWGPPGTGKTSMMLRSWVWYYFTQTTSRIILLAYTNRAVDEICEALHRSGQGIQDHYIRIGSRAATGELYRHRLLDQVIEPMKRRADIRNLLESTRIYVATVASLQGKSELFQLIPFEVAIIDEASQLLEPSLAGLLTKFKKTILIGDHMQLPAVSVQPAAMSKIKPGKEWCQRIGLTDMSMSYFERMYRLYQDRGWHHLIGILHEQGRMHQDIMRCVNEEVYRGELRLVDPTRQGVSMDQVFVEASAPLFKNRLIFVAAQPTLAETYLKTNQEEAEITIALIDQWVRQIKANHLDWNIGVITPFRAQIAAISYLAHVRNIDLSQVTIDTVERYQGGARDIIIMSCAVNSSQAMSKITSVNSDGVDRKLNVAITRARQQFILVGDEAILGNEPAYHSLIERCTRLDVTSWKAN